MVKKKRRILEITEFKTKHNIDEKEFIKFSDKFQKFISEQNGFEHRMILTEKGRWIEAIQWRNVDNAKDAIKKAKKSEECKEYFENINEKSINSMYPELVKMY